MKLKIIAVIVSLLFIGCEELLNVEATSMTIERVKLEKLPFSDGSGLAWDELSGPDIFIRFEEENVTGGIETGTNQDISPSDLPVTWSMSPTFTLGDFSNMLEIYIYDEDVLSDDFIDGAAFEFDPSETPDTWTLDVSDNLQITIEVSYEF
ncbi:MAG: hypothetical protein AUJ47_09710 [Candidatus Marinimicrobia bacterium CG1_02_48_14]|nr:MAG: hypothetical protein AUJ47_09710 [Candidatus Marinimicrobia bacterium CG1_02_48_14]